LQRKIFCPKYINVLDKKYRIRSLNNHKRKRNVQASEQSLQITPPLIPTMVAGLVIFGGEEI
jgi:hypothetical protein